jgi:hypothetical protein
MHCNCYCHINRDTLLYQRLERIIQQWLSRICDALPER